MEYRIILTKNKKRRKILYTCRTQETAINKFNEIIKNNKIIFPQRYVNYKKIIPVKYHLLLVRERLPDDKNRMIRDDAGRIVEEKIKNDKWIIIESTSFDIEETFWVYGHHPQFDRFDIKRILKEILLKDIRKKNFTTSIIVIQNKVVFQLDDDIEIVFCKNKKDAIRLHDTLMESAITSRIDKLLFMGYAGFNMSALIYEKIQEKTGWKMKHVRRPSTRH